MAKRSQPHGTIHRILLPRFFRAVKILLRSAKYQYHLDLQQCTRKTMAQQQFTPLWKSDIWPSSQCWKPLWRNAREQVWWVFLKFFDGPAYSIPAENALNITSQKRCPLWSEIAFLDQLHTSYDCKWRALHSHRLVHCILAITQHRPLDWRERDNDNVYPHPSPYFCTLSLCAFP